MNEDQIREYVASRVQHNDPTIVLIGLGLLQLDEMKLIRRDISQLTKQFDSATWSGHAMAVLPK